VLKGTSSIGEKRQVIIKQEGQLQLGSSSTSEEKTKKKFGL
jgi:hypothetical protein